MKIKRFEFVLEDLEYADNSDGKTGCQKPSFPELKNKSGLLWVRYFDPVIVTFIESSPLFPKVQILLANNIVAVKTSRSYKKRIIEFLNSFAYLDPVTGSDWYTFKWNRSLEQISKAQGRK